MIPEARRKLREVAETARRLHETVPLHPSVMIELLDALEEQEKRLRREIADEVMRLCSMNGDRKEGIVGMGLAMLISPTPVSDEAMEWAKSAVSDIEAGRANDGRPLQEFRDQQRAR